jgi:hypothetical protein
VSYLGHLIGIQGVATDNSKISTIADWPTPQNVKELHSFLGLVGCYRKFIKNFGSICQSLTNSLKKGVLYVWTSNHHKDFSTLKHALVMAPVLALPNFSKPLMIEIDASDGGVGDVLMRDGHPLAFLNNALRPKFKGLSTYEKEYMTIILAVQQWRPYLQQGSSIST